MNWHRLFGLILTDFFRGSPFEVEIEKDLSLKKQLLDVVVVRKTQDNFDKPLPDGMDDLVAHNLISFKSFREPFNAWTIKELLSYYVNYRKQVSPSMRDLLPEEDFRCIGVSARFPEQLAGVHPLEERSAGVYNCCWGTDDVRVIVAGELPPNDQNALLHLFSADAARVQFGTEHYQQQSDESSTLITQLTGRYREEGVNVPYTMEDFKRELKDELKAKLPQLTLEERLEGVPAEEILKTLSKEELRSRLTLDERLEGIPAEEILKALSKEEIREYLKKEEILKTLSKEEILKTLSKEEIREYLKKLDDADSPANGG